MPDIHLPRSSIKQASFLGDWVIIYVRGKDTVEAIRQVLNHRPAAPVRKARAG